VLGSPGKQIIKSAQRTAELPYFVGHQPSVSRTAIQVHVCSHRWIGGLFSCRPRSGRKPFLLFGQSQFSL